jgi:hypothetical protein
MSRHCCATRSEVARTTVRIPATLYTLGDLERRTGVKRRILQIWGDSGVLLPEGRTAHGGKGIHRRFPASEAIVAVLVKPLAEANIQIGHLAGLAQVVRNGLGVHPPPEAYGTAGLSHPAIRDRFPGMRYGEGIPTIVHALSRALRGEGENFLLIAYNPSSYLSVGTIEEDDPENPPPSGIAAFFRKPLFRREPPGMAFCLNLKRLAGIFDEDPPG